VAGAPSVELELGLSHRGYAAFAFALPLIAAAALEAGLALLSDLWDRTRLVVLGQAVLAASLAFTAWTTSPWGLTFGLALAGASSGVACGAAQALLVVSNRAGAERAMVRWSLSSAMGDVLAPLLTATAITLGHSYRGAMLVVAAVVALQCLVSAVLLRRQKPPAEDADDAEEPAAVPLRAALTQALHRPGLWTWLFAAASCTFLDELVIALAALRLERHGAGAAFATAAAVAFSLGSVGGAALTDRLVARISPRRLLVASGLLCAVALGGFLASGTPLTSCLALLVMGLTCAPHHPLAQARAYAELPDRPGTVQAIGQLFVVLDVLAPLAIGWIADRHGLGAAIACLVVQPVVIVGCAALGRPDFRGPSR
jgi:MFS family permease